MKKLLLFFVACAFAITTNAQLKNFNTNSSFGDNWSIGLEGGIQTNLDAWNAPQGAVFGLNLNKDFNPYFGVSIEALMGIFDNANWYYGTDKAELGNGVDNLTGFLTGRWNVFNSLGGFKGHRRVFEIETNVGAGYGRFFTKKAFTEDWNAFQVKTGLDLNFYLNEERSISLNLRPAVIWNISETGKFDSRYAVAQLTAGLTYNFKTSNGTHYFVKSDVSTLSAELASLQEINESLKAQLAARPVEQEVKVEKIVEKVEVPTYLNNTFLVNFAFDSSELLGDAKADLDKIPANSTVSIAGYASPEGNPEYNQRLSQRRADAVKTYLESRGIKVAECVGYGAENAESNRIVMVTVK